MTGCSLTADRSATVLDCTRAGCIAASMISVAAAVAAATRPLAAAPIRAWLRFPFGGVKPQLGEVAAILVNNLRLLGALFAATIVAQLAVRTRGTGLRALAWTCDAVVVLACANHAFLVGATIGGYGSRGIRALLPHGPIELAGYSLALSLYVAARRERLARPRALAIGGLSVVVLVIAAVLEVMA
jgi:hypothetical protein